MSGSEEDVSVAPGLRTRRSTTCVFDPALALFTAIRQVTDSILHEHEHKVGKIVRLLAMSMGLPQKEADELAMASSVHDIGKFAIPRTILDKQGALTPAEIEEVRKHAVNGAQILIRGGYDPDSVAVQIARFHHEHFDGSGYTKGLSGADIPLAARLTTVADVYDALRAFRPYKKQVGHDATIRIILSGDTRTSPDHFDPDVLHALHNNHERVREAWELAPA